MAQLTNDTTNNLWVATVTANNVGISTLLLNTENKFVDKNISFKLDVPAASDPSFSITDKASTNITVDSDNLTSANNVYYYPLKAGLEGQFIINTPGWIGQERSTTYTLKKSDNDVIVGRIKQSTISQDIIVPGTTTATVTVSDGYYHSQRSIIIKPMSEGIKATATVAVSGSVGTPSAAHAPQTISGLQQVDITITTSQPTTANNNKFFISFTATAPASTPTFTKQVTQAGYLGAISQITTSGSMSAANQTFYSIIDTGSLTLSGNSATATAPTIAKINTDGSAAGTNIYSSVGTISSTEPTSGYYALVSVTAPASTVTLNAGSVTPGWIQDASQVTINNATINANGKNFYIPITTGTLTSNSSTATAVATGLTLGTGTATQPSSGKYIKILGNGIVKVDTAGYLPANTTAASATKTYYYPIATATFSVSGSNVIVNGAGWADANRVVGTVVTATLANTPTNGQTYTSPASTPVLLPNDGTDSYLYINAGYLPNTKISLGDLIPQAATAPATTATMLKGFEAYDQDGKRIIGAMETYDGTYSWSS